MKRYFLIWLVIVLLAIPAFSQVKLNLGGGGGIAPLLVGDTTQTLPYGGWVRLGVEWPKITVGVQSDLDMNYFNDSNEGARRSYANEALSSPSDVAISRLFVGPYISKKLIGPLYGTATAGATFWWMSDLAIMGDPLYAKYNGTWTDLMGTNISAGLGLEVNQPLFWYVSGIIATELRWHFGGDDFTQTHLGSGGQLRLYAGLGVDFPLSKGEISVKKSSSSAQVETVKVVTTKEVSSVPKDLTPDGLRSYAEALNQAADSVEKAMQNSGSTLKGTVLGDPLILSGFKVGSAEITGSMEDQLEDFLKPLKKSSDVHVVITGHTDEVGSVWKNLALSYDRAKAIKDWLVRSGIDPERLSIDGQGENDPLIPNNQPKERWRNRRAVLVFYIPLKE
ncbi:MAG: OmpA family protein [Patescibacteria group bacterium]|nr:OmpA family protein [Patescibacteria group bacterium]